jgi:L-asparaginase / beta-aspartyl-peptidase
MEKFAIGIHGGAGFLPFWGMTAEREKEFREGLSDSLRKGIDILARGGKAVDAVEAALISLENNPLFNAGRGAAISREGLIELDASVMCGSTLKAGAVSCLRNVKNPIRLARLVMEHSGHLYLSGEGAEEFAKEMGLEPVENEYFMTEERTDRWRTEIGKKKFNYDAESGTAGAVALDTKGNLAAGTSTGGLMMKRRGRVGDSAVIGAGTYANNETCAVSCTGTGENIIRAVTAHEISSLLKYKGMDLSEACEKMLQEKLTPFGGHAGLVAIDTEGSIKYVFNTERMYRAWRDTSGQVTIKLYEDD